MVVGGLNEEERLRSARETACRPVDGAVVACCGLSLSCLKQSKLI